MYLCFVDEIDDVILSHFPNKTKAIDFKFQVSSFNNWNSLSSLNGHSLQPNPKCQRHSLSHSSFVITTPHLSFITISLTTTTFTVQVLSLSLSHYIYCGFCFVKNDKLNRLFELSTGTGKRRPFNSNRRNPNGLPFFCSFSSFKSNDTAQPANDGRRALLASLLSTG